MVKLYKLANGNGFDGVRNAAKIGKFDQYNTLGQFIDDRAHLTFGEARCRQRFQRCNNIK